MAEIIYIVDPLSDERRRIVNALAGEPVVVMSYDDAAQFLDQVATTASGCVLVPLDLPGMGLRALMDEILAGPKGLHQGWLQGCSTPSEHQDLQLVAGRRPQGQGGRLGVRYVLQGSVRRAAEKVRITGQLIDGCISCIQPCWLTPLSMNCFSSLIKISLSRLDGNHVCCAASPATDWRLR
jgi:CheY-like chemotaxis protein